MISLAVEVFFRGGMAKRRIKVSKTSSLLTLKTHSLIVGTQLSYNSLLLYKSSGNCSSRIPLFAKSARISALSFKFAVIRSSLDMLISTSYLRLSRFILDHTKSIALNVIPCHFWSKINWTTRFDTRTSRQDSPPLPIHSCMYIKSV